MENQVLKAFWLEIHNRLRVYPAIPVEGFRFICLYPLLSVAKDLIVRVPRHAIVTSE
jgi:hypothetical protein